MNKTLDTKKNIGKVILTVLTVLVAIVSGYYVFLFLYMSSSRIAFPLTFDWVEGATLVQANRILLGQKLYLEPSVNYIPLVYQPLYFYIAAVFIKIFGVGLMPIRLISVLSTCGCILMIFLITRKLSGAYLAGLVSAGLFAATNQFVRTWFDLARVDMLSMFFFMAGLYCVTYDNRRASILVGVLFALSFFTKQTTIPIIFLIFAYYFFVKRKQALIFIMTFCLLIGVGTLLLIYESNGLYIFYIYKLPSYHRLYTNIDYFWNVTKNILQPVLIVLGVIFFSIMVNLKKMLRNHNECLLIIITIATLILSIWGGLIVGSTRNAFIPAYALIAIMFGLGLAHLQKNSAEIFGGNFRFISTTLLLGICLLQFSSMRYNVQNYIPTTQDFEQAAMLINYLKATDEETLMPRQNYLALYINKKIYYHAATLGEFTGEFGNPLPQWEKIKKEIVKTVRSGEVSFVYMDAPKNMWLGMKCKNMDVFQPQSRFIENFYKMACH